MIYDWPTITIGIVGILVALIGIGQAFLLWRHNQIDNRFEQQNQTMLAFVKELAELRVLISAFDKEEFSRHRHRITNLEIEHGRLKEEVESIKQRCKIYHNEQR